jgi:hypothetical protein
MGRIASSGSKTLFAAFKATLVDKSRSYLPASYRVYEDNRLFRVQPTAS